MILNTFYTFHIPPRLEVRGQKLEVSRSSGLQSCR